MQNSLTILYVYKDKDRSRVSKSLLSLQNQTNVDFNVLFIDFGSNTTFSEQIQSELKNFDFVKYQYSYHQNKPWSRAKAINIGLKLVETEYVFVADIDMIFKENFVSTLHAIKSPTKSIYFKVGFLNQAASEKDTSFENYKISFESQAGAQGLSLFPTQALKDIHGFDEFLHFWGAEDEDIHNRLKTFGLEEIFYNQEVLMVHQWHEIYRKAESSKLSCDLRINAISKINQARLIYNKVNLRTIVNKKWGEIRTKHDFETLNNHSETIKIIIKKENIDHFLFSELPSIQNQIISVEFIEDQDKNSLKRLAKKWLKKSVPQYYSLKEVNDAVLLHIISFYHNYNYFYKVSEDKKSIKFRIQK
ncbi:MAG: glycosyltransferase [Flavobacterium sp.]|nr:glycosyltransferase [Flavobacterium sp.]